MATTPSTQSEVTPSDTLPAPTPTDRTPPEQETMTEWLAAQGYTWDDVRDWILRG